MRAFRVCSASVLISAVLWAVLAVGATEAPRRILILYGYNYTLPATAAAAEGIRTRLLERSAHKIELDAEFLDLARFSEPEQELLMASFLRERYARRQPDVVLAMGPDAVSFIIKHRDSFAPGVPTVVIGLPLERPSSPLPNVTGHIFDLEAYLEGTLTLAERLQPDARRLFVIAGSSATDRYWQAIARKVIGSRNRKLETTYLFDLSYDEFVAEVSRIPRDAIVVALTIFSDKAGRTFIPLEMAATLAGVSPAPVYAPHIDWVGRGLVGGFGETFESMGRLAADMALEILAGRDPAAVSPRANPDRAYRVDFRAMQRWGLSESNLPPGTMVMHKNPTIWELYRWYIVGVASLIVFQTLLIAGLFVQRSRRQAAEAGILVREGALRRSYEQLRQLAGRLISAQEEERTRIARELHDDVGQRIASLSIGLSGLKRRVPDANETVRNDVSLLQQQTMDLAKDLRDLSHELHPGALEHIGLIEALHARCEEMNSESDTDIQLEVADGWTEVADDVKLCLYRVAQEALRNIIKHAQAKTGRISVSRQEGWVVMRISDDGSGFEMNGSGQHGLGLLSMRERVRMLDGNFEVHSSPGAGTVATVSIPTGDGR